MEERYGLGSTADHCGGNIPPHSRFGFAFGWVFQLRDRYRVEACSLRCRDADECAKVSVCESGLSRVEAVLPNLLNRPWGLLSARANLPSRLPVDEIWNKA